MPERAKTADRLPSHERVQFQEGLVGLQARLLIGGEALNPNKLDLAPVTSEALGNFEGRNYSPLTAASTGERREYWQGKENDDFQQQKTRWVTNLVSLFEKNKVFFQRDREGKEWSELFSKIGINTQSFSQQNAVSVYEKYFTGESKDSNVKLFISDIVAAYRNPGGQIDYQKLKQNINGIQWLAHIFGDVSSEVVAQLLDAEVKLQTQPQELINAANQQQENALRINNLLPKEKELLAFLAGTQPTIKPTIPPTQPLPPKKPEKDKWEYIRFKPSESRKLPIPNPFTYIAEVLIKEHPYLLKQGSAHEITEAVRKEIEKNYFDLEQKGIKMDEFGQWIIGQFRQAAPTFPQYLENKYNVSIPSYEGGIQVIPINGEVARTINSHGALAFVNPSTPGLFLDLDVINNAAKRLAGKEGWRMIPQSEFNRFLERIFREVSPHELVHLFSDVAFWEKLNISKVGKIGVLVSKPVKEEQINGMKITNFWSRGNELDEAVTHEIIIRWAKDNNVTIDMPDIYQTEREVLTELIKMTSKERGISDEEAFIYFAKALFTPKDFRHLIETLDGHKKIAEGKFITQRPHFTSIIYFLMDYEVIKIRERLMKGEKNVHFDLTLGFIRGNLTKEQKIEINALLDAYPSYTLSPSARKHLGKITGKQEVDQTSQIGAFLKIITETGGAASHAFTPLEIETILNQNALAISSKEVDLPYGLKFKLNPQSEKPIAININYPQGRIDIDGTLIGPTRKHNIYFIFQSQTDGSLRITDHNLPEISGFNIDDQLKSLDIRALLKQLLQQLADQRGNQILIEDVSLRFTPENKIEIALKTRKI